jgi:hypothetical protein
LTAPPSLSQSSTPFVASWRQDIPHTPLVAWPHWSRPPAVVPPQKETRSSQATAPLRSRGRVTIHSRSKGSQSLTSPSPGRLAPSGNCALVRQLLPLPNCQRTPTWPGPSGAQGGRPPSSCHAGFSCEAGASLARRRSTSRPVLRLSPSRGCRIPVCCKLFPSFNLQHYFTNAFPTCQSILFVFFFRSPGR